MSVTHAACAFRTLTGSTLLRSKTAAPTLSLSPSAAVSSVYTLWPGIQLFSFTLTNLLHCHPRIRVHRILWVFLPVVLQRYLLQLLLVGCSTSVIHTGLVPDSQHYYLSARAVLVSTASSGPPLFPLEFHALLGGSPFPGNPRRT